MESMLITDGWDDYRLLDMGEGRKLEQCGPYRIDRPEPQAMGRRRLPQSAWDGADAVFTGADDDEAGRWKFKAGAMPPDWTGRLGDARFIGRFTNFRHVGYFPEQKPHWDDVRDRLRAAPGKPALLNLFAYTGVASLLAAQAGAAVTHLDASKKAIAWAKENAALSGLADNAIRWICEDARAFAAREVRRGKTYDGILLDPPKFGRGTDGEVWNLFDDLPALLHDCRKILAPGGFLVLTSYAIRASSLAFRELCADVFTDDAVSIQSGELALRIREDGRLLSTSHFVRVVRA